MKYLKVWTNFLDFLGPLEKSEIGDLFLMMLKYAESGEEPEFFAGNEVFLWPVAKQMIDLAAEKNETLRQNGSKGGRQKTKENQTEPNGTKRNQTEPNGSKEKQTQAYKEKKRKEIERNEISSSLLDEDDAHAIQNDQDIVLDAAEDAGFKMSNDVRASLIALYSEHGLDKVLDGIKSCSEYGASNLAYLRACLSGTKKKEKPRVSAQDFPQRDYSGVQDEMMDSLAKEIEAMKAAEVG